MISETKSGAASFCCVCHATLAFRPSSYCLTMPFLGVCISREAMLPGMLCAAADIAISTKAHKAAESFANFIFPPRGYNSVLPRTRGRVCVSTRSVKRGGEGEGRERGHFGGARIGLDFRFVFAHIVGAWAG